MTPDFLRSSYKQYKADSDAVATWLANTARRCGYPIDLLSDSKSSQKAPKLKGRARKLARDAGKKNPVNSKDTTATEASHQYVIRIREFMSLAEWILKSTKPVIQVPSEIVTALNSAIAARKGHNHYWDGKDDGSDDKRDLKQANENHSHFIGVLEQVRNTLRPRMSPAIVESVPAIVTEYGLPSVTNQFESLSVSQPDTTEVVAHVEQPAKTQQTQPLRFTLEQEPDLDEVGFAVDCFFHDLANLRRYLKGVWDGYRQGAFDLVAASLVTNTAIEFVRGFEEDFTQTFPQHADFAKHTQLLYFRACLEAGSSPMHKELPNDEMNFAAYDAADETFFPTYLLLSSFESVIQPRSVPIYRPGHYGTYDAKSDRDSKSARDKFREDKVILLQVLPEFCLLASLSDVIPVEDEMIRGMRLLVNKKPITMWLIFGAQIFLDVNHILRDDISRGFQALRKSASFAESSISDVLKFHTHLRVDTWPKSNDQGLFMILDIIKQCVNQDVVESARKKIRNSHGLPSPEAFLLLRQHPLLCGLLSFKIKALTQEASIVFVNAWGGILYTAHLYNAVRQEKMLAKCWKDMNLALMMHRIQDMFIGAFPKTIDDYFKRYTLAMGYSAANFASNRSSKKGPTASKAGPRCLDDLSPVSNIFRSRFSQGENISNFSPEDIEMVLKKYADDEDMNDVYVDENGEEWKTPQLAINIKEDSVLTDDQKEAISKLDKRQKKMKSSTSVEDGVRPIQLLNALLNELQSETIELAFDHFQLHMSCWRLLRAVQQELHEDLKRYYQAGYLEKENQLPFVVGYIFMTATSIKRLAGTLMPKKQDVVTNKLLEKAAKVVEKMIECGDGEIVYDSLQRALNTEIDMPDIIEDMLG